MKQDAQIPAVAAAIQLRTTREVVIRRIQKGELAGGQDTRGRWFVAQDALDRAVTAQAVAV